jgi:hypothetical protein
VKGEREKIAQNKAKNQTFFFFFLQFIWLEKFKVRNQTKKTRGGQLNKLTLDMTR